VSCSRGTYIRSLARDVGKQLGWGGALASLTRTAIGPYRVEAALSLEDVAARRSEFAA
jgi:tRNA pseudouridine55 synthase